MSLVYQFDWGKYFQIKPDQVHRFDAEQNSSLFNFLANTPSSTSGALYNFILKLYKEDWCDHPLGEKGNYLNFWDYYPYVDQFSTW